MKNKSKGQWIGLGLSGLVTVALAFFALIKFVQPGDYAENAAQMGMQSQHLLVLGILLAVCAVTYAIPKTKLIGAVLTTGYFGGAISVHFLANDPLGNFALPVLLPVIAWLAIYLRDDRIKAAVCSCASSTASV